MAVSLQRTVNGVRAAYDAATSYTSSVQVDSGATLLLFCMAGEKFQIPACTGVTYGGVALTASIVTDGGVVSRVKWWYLLNPAVGTENLVASWPNNAFSGSFSASVWAGSHASSPIANTDKADNTTATGYTPVPSTASDGACAIGMAGNTSQTIALGTGVVQDIVYQFTAGGPYAGVYHRLGATGALTWSTAMQASGAAVIIAAAATALTWTGTIGAQTGTVGSAISPLATSGYVSGGTAPYTYSATGLAGSGLSINSSTGSITGTPTTAAVYTVTVSATDSAGSPATVSSPAFSWTISAAAPSPSPSPAPAPSYSGMQLIQIGIDLHTGHLILLPHG